MTVARCDTDKWSSHVARRSLLIAIVAPASDGAVDANREAVPDACTDRNERALNRVRVRRLPVSIPTPAQVATSVHRKTQGVTSTSCDGPKRANDAVRWRLCVVVQSVASTASIDTKCERMGPARRDGDKVISFQAFRWCLPVLVVPRLFVGSCVSVDAPVTGGTYAYA